MCEYVSLCLSLCASAKHLYHLFRYAKQTQSRPSGACPLAVASRACAHPKFMQKKHHTNMDGRYHAPVPTVRDVKNGVKSNRARTSCERQTETETRPMTTFGFIPCVVRCQPVRGLQPSAKPEANEAAVRQLWSLHQLEILRWLWDM